MLFRFQVDLFYAKALCSGNIPLHLYGRSLQYGCFLKFSPVWGHISYITWCSWVLDVSTSDDLVHVLSGGSTCFCRSSRLWICSLDIEPPCCLCVTDGSSSAFFCDLYRQAVRLSAQNLYACAFMQAQALSLCLCWLWQHKNVRSDGGLRDVLKNS